MATLNDSLVGTAENDSIVSGGGVDTLRGLAGNDYYVVSDARSLIIELPGGGYDTESVEGSYDQHWTVPDNIEWFRWANPSGADPRFTFFEFDGNAQDNLIQLFNGRVSVNGGAGNDTISANADSYGVSTVRGGAGDDELYGSGSGTYYLDGGEGDDTLTVAQALTFFMVAKATTPISSTTLTTSQ
jgi:Ca2+-binding RTX toxin-like protein